MLCYMTRRSEKAAASLLALEAGMIMLKREKDFLSINLGGPNALLCLSFSRHGEMCCNLNSSAAWCYLLKLDIN